MTANALKLNDIELQIIKTFKKVEIIEKCCGNFEKRRGELISPWQFSPKNALERFSRNSAPVCFAFLLLKTH